MADIYLGATESGAILLPRLRWMGGSAPELGTEYSNSINLATMLNGEIHAHFKEKDPRRWMFEGLLTPAELAGLIALKELDQELYLQNNWESADWHTVVIVDFRCPPITNAGPNACYYSISMTLQEVG